MHHTQQERYSSILITDPTGSPAFVQDSPANGITQAQKCQTSLQTASPIDSTGLTKHIQEFMVANLLQGVLLSVGKDTAT